MVHIKRMNEEYFAKLLKDLTAAGELVRARQEEKQKLLDALTKKANVSFLGKFPKKLGNLLCKKQILNYKD